MNMYLIIYIYINRYVCFLYCHSYTHAHRFGGDILVIFQMILFLVLRDPVGDPKLVWNDGCRLVYGSDYR